MPGLVIGGNEVEVPGLTVLNWNDDARLLRSPEDGRDRPTAWVRNVIVHTTKGIPGGKKQIPQTILSGGKDAGKEFHVAEFWANSKVQSGAHLIIDTDGSIGCIADLQDTAMFHAGNRKLNYSSIGIEIYQLAEGEIYEASLDACVVLVDFICSHFGIQRQMHWPYKGKPTRRLERSGDNCVGVFGHRDLTARRGRGDPGDEIMLRLRRAGFEAFDLDSNEDVAAWRPRQEELGLKADGTPGPKTVAALKAAGYTDGLYTLGKVELKPEVKEGLPPSLIEQPSLAEKPTLAERLELKTELTKLVEEIQGSATVAVVKENFSEESKAPSNPKTPLLSLHLHQFTAAEVLGIYGPSNTQLAKRMRYLEPAAAASFKKMDAEKRVKCSDMLRTPEGSLKSRRKKGAGLRPGWSGHNYGFSIDIDVSWVLQEHKFKNKEALDLWMAGHGWYCHNVPGTDRSFEAWHYNYFGAQADHFLSFRTSSKKTWSKPIAQKINEFYGPYWEEASLADVQTALKKLGFYLGAIDGDFGLKSKAATKLFQQSWDLDIDGVPGPMTKRTLMLVSAERVISNG